MTRKIVGLYYAGIHENRKDASYRDLKGNPDDYDTRIVNALMAMADSSFEYSIVAGKLRYWAKWEDNFEVQRQTWHTLQLTTEQLHRLFRLSFSKEAGDQFPWGHDDNDLDRLWSIVQKRFPEIEFFDSSKGSPYSHPLPAPKYPRP